MFIIPVLSGKTSSEAEGCDSLPFSLNKPPEVGGERGTWPPGCLAFPSGCSLDTGREVEERFPQVAGGLLAPRGLTAQGFLGHPGG